MNNVWVVMKVRPKYRSWEAVTAYESHEEALNERDRLQSKYLEQGSEYQFLVQGVEYKGAAQ